MINLFVNFDLLTKLLYNTLKGVSYNNTIVLEDDGFLPEDISSPYQFFSGVSYKHDNPRFFNKIKIPEFWEIEGNKNFAVIMNKKQIKGKIFYASVDAERIVKSVEWYGINQKLKTVDHYTADGRKYAESIYNKEGICVLQHYFNADGKEIMMRNMISGSVLLYWNDITYHFEKYIQFVEFYIKQLNVEEERFLINSLGLPLSIINKKKSDTPHIVIWQEYINDELPGNMKVVLASSRFKLMVPDHQEYERISHIIKDSNLNSIQSYGYLYNKVDCKKEKNHILILTNSDRLRKIDKIITALPEFQFIIAAKTDVSNRLTNLEQYHNVEILAKVSKHKINELFMKCDIYLDINEGIEVENALQTAFEHNMIIFSFNNTLHNKRVVSSDTIFREENTEDMIHLIKYGDRVKLGNLQDKVASVITKEQARKIFEK